MKPADAVVFTSGLLAVDYAKTCHGLLRGSERFNVVAVIDHVHAGKDAGTVLDGRPRGVPVFASIRAFFSQRDQDRPQPKVFVIGVAFSGGRLPDECRGEIIAAVKSGMSVVCGLHQFLGEDPEFRQLAAEHDVDLIDIRKSRPLNELRFWTGEVRTLRAKVIPVLGTDCAVGKRTTCRLLTDACRADGIAAEMMYTGQTGWMQGIPYGFILDATMNDFVSGELERVLLECEREASPEVILIEGQASLRNPSGPCGSELLLSTNASGVVLQHAPGRTHFIDHEDVADRVPPVEEEIELIKMYGVDTLAVTLNQEGVDPAEMDSYSVVLSERLGIPVVWPLRHGVAALVPAIKALLD